MGFLKRGERKGGGERNGVKEVLGSEAWPIPPPE
jgi:hypothetical protein